MFFSHRFWYPENGHITLGKMDNTERRASERNRENLLSTFSHAPFVQIICCFFWIRFSCGEDKKRQKKAQEHGNVKECFLINADFWCPTCNFSKKPYPLWINISCHFVCTTAWLAPNISYSITSQKELPCKISMWVQWKRNSKEQKIRKKTRTCRWKKQKLYKHLISFGGLVASKTDYYWVCGWFRNILMMAEIFSVAYIDKKISKTNLKAFFNPSTDNNFIGAVDFVDITWSDKGLTM